MQVFVSWPKERSRCVAELISEWISDVIQQIKPWISTEAPRGTLWFSNICSKLNEVQNGIVCLTKENLNEPWILFEAGALAKRFENSRVYTFLVDLTPEEVSDPLAQFNHTQPTKGSMLQLIGDLNKRLGEDALPDEKLQKSFDLHWPQFEVKFKKILADTTEGESPPPKTEREILDSILLFMQRAEKNSALLSELLRRDADVDHRIAQLFYRATHDPIIQNDRMFRSVPLNYSDFQIAPYSYPPKTESGTEE